jgi:hypothetical protein
MSSKRETTSVKSKAAKSNQTKAEKTNRTSFKNEPWYQSISSVIGASKNSTAPSQ